MNGINKKRCITCKQMRPIACFHRSCRTKDGFSNFCKNCYPVEKYAKFNGYNKKDYHPKRVYLTSSKLKPARIKVWNDYYTKGCMLCDEKELCCLDFHHIDSSTKLYLVSNIWGAVDPNILIQEIEKCIVVCKNCHAKIHSGKIRQIPSPIILSEDIKGLFCDITL